jgi:hypothetical protein
MKKMFIISALFAACKAIVIACKNKSKEPSAVRSKEDSLKMIVDRGSYLTHHVAVCMDCHSQRDFTKFSGPIIPGTEGIGGDKFDQGVGIPGVLTAPNITPAALSN